MTTSHTTPSHIDRQSRPTAIVTGGSAGLGRALTDELANLGWNVITDARRGDRLADLAALPHVTPIAGDIRDLDHQHALRDAADSAGRLDLLVHNASSLGPMLPLEYATTSDLTDVLDVNVVAPLALTQALLPLLRASSGRLVGISSDAAIEHYPTWGTYAASKAALDHVVLTLGEETELPAYAVDPGDMRTEMHQQAFPGEDISDRPLPETVVGRLIELITSTRPSGRYRLADIPEPTTTTTSMTGATR